MDCVGETAGLFPPCLFPDTVQVELVHRHAQLAGNRHAAFLRRMFELAVVADRGDQIPPVFFQQLDDFFYFVTFHYLLFLLFDTAKVILLILLCKYFDQKVIK